MIGGGVGGVLHNLRAPRESWIRRLLRRLGWRRR